jgi:nitrate reductase delta subunit
MKIFRLIAALLDYPDDEFLAGLREAAQQGAKALVAEFDQAGLLDATERDTLADFIDALLAREPMELQGAYVRDFDLTAEHSLHLTHHLFGEEKTRGPALIDLGEFYKSHGLVVDEKELPDYLPVMLEFAAELSLEEVRVFLGEVRKVLTVLAANLEKSGSAYAPLVRIVENQSSLTRLAT